MTYHVSLYRYSSCSNASHPCHYLCTGGTKGSDTVATDLGVVSGSGSQVEVELPADQKDVDAAYSDALDNLRIRKPLDKPMGLTASQIELRQKDYYVGRIGRCSNEARLLIKGFVTSPPGQLPYQRPPALVTHEWSPSFGHPVGG